MASRSSNQQFHGHVSSRNILYRLPMDMPTYVLTNFTNKLGWLHNKEFAISRTIDWVRFGEIGLMERMAPFLTKQFSMDDFFFTCNGWRNLFAISKPDYQELCVVFFASVSFEGATVDPFYPRDLIFRLGCKVRECSLP